MERKLVIFDVDGTLTDTMGIDTYCFAQTIREIYPKFIFSENWESYQYSTDTGFLIEIFNDNCKREPNPIEMSQVKTHFMKHLRYAFHEQRVACTPIQGALSIFEQIQSIGWDVAIATGCWEESALLKLDLSSIPYLSVPIGHGDDGFKREDIILSAIEKSKKQYQAHSFQHVVYIGDRAWDKKAAKDAQVDFIGIGRDFESHGDVFCIEDYLDNQLVPYLMKKCG